MTATVWLWVIQWALLIVAAYAVGYVREGRMRRRIAQERPTADQDALLAEWCRHMQLTVITVSGAVFSSSLAELHATSEAPTFRSWHVPAQVTVWSDQGDEELTAEVRQNAAKDGFSD